MTLVILSDERYPAMEKIIAATPDPGIGPMRVRSWKRRAESALRAAGYSEEEILAGWEKYWAMMLRLSEERATQEAKAR